MKLTKPSTVYNDTTIRHHHNELLKETDGETINVTMDSYHDIEMRNELHVDGV